MQKNPSKFLIICFLLLSAALRLEAQEKIPDPVKVTTVEGITEYQLANGLRVLLFPDQTKETITVNITYLVGSKHENYGETGMAHLLEHLVFKGTPRHPNIPQELTERGARPNGTTWTDRTNYFETFKATDDNLRWALDLEADRMVNSFISAKDLESEMTVVRNEFESGENSPYSMVIQRTLSAAYLWHNYGKSTIGAKSDLENVPIERLQNFYRTYYQPDNAVLVVAGKIDEEKTIQLVNEFIGPIPKPERVLPQFYTRDPDQDGERRITIRRVGDTQLVGLAHKISSVSHPDAAPLVLLSTIMNDNPSGRIYKSLVDTQLASFIFGQTFLWKEPGIMMTFAEVPKEKSMDEALNAMIQTVETIKTTPITSDEVERARNRWIKQFDLGFNSSEQIGLQLSEYIGAGDWRLMFIQRDRIKEATLEDVQRVASNYLKQDNRTIGLFVPTENPDRTSIPEDVDVMALVKDYKGGEGLAMGEAFDPSPANIDSRTTSIELENGMKLAFLPKETRGSSVNFNFTLRFGSEENLKNKGEIGAFTAQMLDKGTATKSREQIKDEFDRLKAQVNIFGSASTLSIFGQTTKENLPGVMKLLKEILLSPAFPKEELDKMILESVTDIESSMSDPTSRAFNRLTRHMNPYEKEDPRYAKTFEEDIAAKKAVTIDQVKDFYANYLGANHGTGAIVGDVEVETILPLLEDIFEGWNSKVDYARLQGRIANRPAINEAIETPDKPNAFFVAMQQFEMNDQHPDHPALVLGNFMLGGGFLNSRLATRIRQKDGLSYGVGSGYSAGSIDPIGTFQGYAIYAPENLEKLEIAFKEEIQKVLDEGFTEEEVEAAKTGWLQSRTVNRASDNYLSSVLNGNLFLNRTMEREQLLEDQVNALTPQQIQEAMKRHLDLNKMSIVKAGEFTKE
ncbi:pitrilysin family protein [Algoriphagus confluentis]|uniref:Pitrilysin family protein n=1 Tax=Algoriphagus confluentis TaxID=1697556 RepID=A0ABQ6PHT4_9BACT|nr:pitrilysin family protein [Algoriphagus confluentis]